MSSGNQVGSAKAVAVIILLVLALAGASGFGFWAYSERQDYKNNVDKKIALSVAAAEKVQADKLKKEFEEQSKSPYTAFESSPTYGTVKFDYPKTWSAYVAESGAQPLNGYFHPKYVPAVGSTTSTTTAYALRVELISSSYSTAMQQYNANIKNGKLKAAAYVPEKLKTAQNVQPGTRIDGEVAPKQNGSMVILPVRDKTLKVYTLSPDYSPDFNKVVLPSLAFTP